MVYSSIKLIMFFAIGKYFCTETVKYEPCVDRYSQCKSWKEQKLCTQESYKQYMISTCPASCNICPADLLRLSENSDETKKNSSVETEESSTHETSEKNQNDQKPPYYKGNQYIQQIENAEKDSSSSETHVVTTVPQAIRLIQSLTQMISQTSGRRMEKTFPQERERSSQKKRKSVDFNLKKPGFGLMTTKKGNFLLPVSRRESIEDKEHQGDKIDLSDNTMRMIIQTKKRSNVQKNKLKLEKKFPHSALKIEATKFKKKTHLKPKKNAKTVKKLQSIQPPVETATDTTYIPSTTEIVDTKTTEETPEGTITPKTTSEPIPIDSNKVITNEKLNGKPCEQDCEVNYSLILKQHFDKAYLDTSSSKYYILKGNLKQDLEYTLGSDSEVVYVEFEEVYGKNEANSQTKVNFVIQGSLENIDELEDMVNKGNVNGLVVVPNSLTRSN